MSRSLLTATSRWITLSCLCLALSALGQSIDVPPGQHEVLKATGRGVQIYRCEQQGSDAKWIFVAPEAQLYVDGVLAGTHAAGPVWSYRDGSSVHGKVASTVPSPTAGNIPLLLLKATESSGKGVLTPVSYIERSGTKGGLISDQVCDAEHIGSTSRVPYTATYTFFAPAK
jgi:Protein of unknown function (DUF3455)